MVILVTGGAGFIGSNLCDSLLSKGKKVICLDNINSYYSPKQKIKNVQHNFSNPNFTFLVMDITNRDQLEKVFIKNKIKKVVHLAARAGVRPSIEDPYLYNEVNIKGTLNLLELARKYNIKQFVFGSSSSVYGENKSIPFKESDMTDNPISPYAVSKKAGELFCYNYSQLYNMNIVCLRFFTVYGPRGRPDMAPYLFTSLISSGKPIKMFGDGTSKRDYTYVSDIIEGIIAALNSNYKFEIINLGNSSPVELKHFISIIEKTVGRKAKIKRLPMQQGDVSITYADVTKAKEMLGYEPKVSLEEGIGKFVEWFKNEQ